MKYVAITIEGEVIDNRGKGYVSLKAAYAACDRRGKVPCDWLYLNQKLPHANDAAGWDALRLERGIAGR